MLLVTLAGNTGKDATHKQTQSGAELCSFPVAAETGFGDNKVTTWIDVTRWGKGAEGLARVLRKGSRVAVVGELSTREHDGKTYLQCRADHVKILGTPDGGQRREPDGSRGHAQQGSPADDLDLDEVPF